MTEMVEIVVNAVQHRWYKERGYNLPTVPVQLWYKNKKGQMRKNGVERRIPRGTKIRVRREDLPPRSNQQMMFECASCHKPYTTTWRAYLDKLSRDCKACESGRVKTTGCHSYWVDRLIVNNAAAVCDISGERDKRFLVLHHLLSRNSGGKDEEANYVVLSANYHLAFHVWNGGMNVPCTPDQYFAFKAEEIAT